MSSRFRAGCGFTVLFLLVAYSLWVSSPPARHRDDIKQAVANFQSRFDARQKLAQDPAQNGLESPSFRTWWGPKPISDPNNPAGLVMRAWNSNYSEPALGKPVDHKDFLARKDAEYLKARQDLEKLLPELMEACKKPVFDTPMKTNPSFNTVVPNFIAIRATAQTLAGYADSLAAEGRIDEALGYDLAGLRLGHLMESGGMLIQEMIGIALKAICFQGAMRCLTSGPVKEEQTWKAIMDTAAEALSSPHQMTEALEGEIYMQQQAFAHPEDFGAEAGNLGRVMTVIPGIMSREHRIMDNVMGDLLVLSQSAEDPDFGPLVIQAGTVSAYALVTGRTSVMAAILVPNLNRAAAQITLSRRYMLCLHTLAALELYRSQKHAYPASLTDLSAVATPLKGFDWSSPDHFQYKQLSQGADLLVKVDPDILNRTGLRGSSNPAPPGLEVVNDGLRLAFPLRGKAPEQP